MAQFAHFTIGQNETFKVLAKLPQSNATSAPLDITDYTFTGKVRENYTTTEVAVEFTINKIEPYSSGAIVLELENSKTKSLELRKYVYDIMAESGSFKRKILEGYINIRPQVTPFTYVIADTREYQYQFEISPFLESSSITLRPDAVSFDYKTAFTLGPIETGSVESGLFNKVWRFRADDQNRILYSVEEGGGWSEEKVLFTYVGQPVIEIDAAFEQQGRPNVVVQRNTGTNNSPQMWLYWFDPFISNFTFQNLGNGRTPRISLDDWPTTTASDILVFYIDDEINTIRYRVQNDRFNVIYNTPITNTQNIYLEKVAFGSDFRYRVTYSERNTNTGKYELKQLATKLYPIPVIEPLQITGSLVSIEIKNFPVYSQSVSAESYRVSGSLVSIDVFEFGRILRSIQPESYTVSGSFVSLDIKNFPVYSQSIVPESYTVSGSFVSLETKEILITKSLFTPETYFVTGSMTSITVDIP
jgi:hypothetical protein